MSYQIQSLKDAPRLNLTTDITTEQIYRMLYKAYQLEVSMRGKELLADEFTIGNIKLISKWIVKGKKKSLLLYGSVGNGKTTMAKAMSRVLKAFGNNDFKIYFVTAPNFVRIKFDKDFASTFAINNTIDYAQCNLLFVDELGAETETIKKYGNVETPIDDLLIYRYEHNKPTVITTNLDETNILARYHDRIMDRIYEQYDMIEYAGESYRSKEIL